MSSLSQNPSSDKPYAVEYYYKTKWGYAEEFIQLYKKNHYPVLKKQMEMGRILSLTLVKPRFHASEDGRWDWRITIIWKNIQVTNDGFSEKELSKQLFPDQEKFTEEEQRRFTLLLGHWDVPVVDIDLEK
ncbi:MAG: hypothetical protein JXA06_02780 [Bacteroidetes bacterium]|nr:hypothetical protein [Bacteroidota bacterium]